MLAIQQKLFAEVGLEGQVGGCSALGETLEARLPDIDQTLFRSFFCLFVPSCGNHTFISKYTSSRKLPQSLLILV